MTVLSKAVALWLGILVLAVANGLLRETLLVPALGGTTGYVTSGVILIACISLVAWTGVPWLHPMTSLQWLSIGGLWVLLTLAFEFGFGRFVQHKTWTDLLEAYTFRGGNIWPVVLAVVLIAPWAAARLRGRI